jgi:DTW domain-containing protein YfiP
MGRRKRYNVRCLVCQMRKEICICDCIESCRRSIETSTRIIILMHHRELCRTTNTARLAQLTLPDCEIRVRGLPDTPSVTEGLIDPHRLNLLLYPTPEAQELTPELVANLKRPITLIVPDGTWGQAAKVAKREPVLQTIPHIKLPLDRASEYALRRGSEQKGVATFEAIARALGLLESQDVQRRLEALFAIMVDRTLRSRGCQPPVTAPAPASPD